MSNDTDSGAHADNVLESAAYPPLLRVVTVVLLIDLVAFAIWSLPALRATSWSTGSLVLFGLAGFMTLWVGWWIVYSRTRLEGDQLTQTWLWNKRVRVHEVTQLKLVHWRWLDRVMAPRLLVRRRNGAVTWFHAADARLLTTFAERVAQQMLPPNPSAQN